MTLAVGEPYNKPYKPYNKLKSSSWDDWVEIYLLLMKDKLECIHITNTIYH